MASNRHLGRIIALQTLFEEELRQEANDKDFNLNLALKRNLERYHRQIEDVEFVKSLVNGVSTNKDKLDEELQPVAPEWPIKQIARMDRLILRLGLYELSRQAEVPAKVVINEAVELAKSFGNDHSSKFVNGVLGTLLKQNEEAASAKKTTKKAKK